MFAPYVESPWILQPVESLWILQPQMQTNVNVSLLTWISWVDWLSKTVNPFDENLYMKYDNPLIYFAVIILGSQ